MDHNARCSHKCSFYSRTTTYWLICEKTISPSSKVFHTDVESLFSLWWWGEVELAPLDTSGTVERDKRNKEQRHSDPLGPYHQSLPQMLFVENPQQTRSTNVAVMWTVDQHYSNIGSTPQVCWEHDLLKQRWPIIETITLSWSDIYCGKKWKKQYNVCLLRRDRTKRQSIGKILATTIGEDVATLAGKFATNNFRWLKKFAWCDSKMTNIKWNLLQTSTKIPQTFSSFAKRSPCSPRFGNIQHPRDYSGTLTFNPQIPKQLVFFPYIH